MAAFHLETPPLRPYFIPIVVLSETMIKSVMDEFPEDDFLNEVHSSLLDETYRRNGIRLPRTLFRPSFA